MAVGGVQLADAVLHELRHLLQEEPQAPGGPLVHRDAPAVRRVAVLHQHHRPVLRSAPMLVVVTVVRVISGVTCWGVARSGRPGVSIPLWWRMRMTMTMMKMVLFGWMLIGRRAVVPGDVGEELCLRGDRGAVMMTEVVVGLRPALGAQAAPLHFLLVRQVVPWYPGEHGGGGGGVEMRGGGIGSVGGATDSAP